MIVKLVEKVGMWADKNNVLHSGTKVVAGVSGGADSVCLLHVLKQLAKERSFSVVAVHVNHMLRGNEAIEDESFVADLCKSWDIPLRIFRENVKALAEKKGLSVEEAGRIVRYNCFRTVLTETGANYIAVAHHAQDQAETVFLNLLRGSGLDGLCGMEEIHGQVMRPFLTTEKREIYDYIKRNKLKYKTDSSNLDNLYARNTIRNVVFPLIEKETGKSMVPPMLRASLLLKADRDYLDRMALKHFDGVKDMEEQGTIILNRKSFLKLHPAMKGRVLRIAWERITGTVKGLESKHVEAAFEVAGKKGTGKSVNWPGGVRVKTDYNRLIITKKEVQKEKPFRHDIQIPCTEEVVDGKLKVTARVYTTGEYIKTFGYIVKMKEKGLVQLFDYNKINEGINIRSRLRGDVFFPFGSPGKKKLKDFFIDEKIPGDMRGKIPLLADGSKIMWVIGVRTAEDYKITENTKEILYVKITDANINPSRR
jgi:tRNA(Ile)-lysidine synthase